MRKQIATTLAVVAISLLTTSARAEEEHRELGPHVHGHGTLNIAIDDKTVSMELEVPGMDVESADDDHLAVEVAQARVIEVAQVREIGSGGVVLDE